MLGRRDPTPRLKNFARNLRKRSTDAERKLWGLLRDRQLENFRFRRQRPIGGFIFDFICLDQNLVVELDGGQHADPAAIGKDAERTRRLENLGLRVLRIPDDEMLKDPQAVIRTILRELTEIRPSP